MPHFELIGSEIYSLLGQLVGVILRGFRYINGGGDFFSHAVFSALASVVISSRLRDFIIAPSGEGIKELKRDIEQKIDQVTRNTQVQDDEKSRLRKAYEKYKGYTEKLSAYLTTEVERVERSCRKWCYVAFGGIILLIGVEWDKHLGALNLLCLLPLLIARIWMGRVYRNTNTKLSKLRTHFNNARNTSQSQYEKEQENVDASIEKKLAPERTGYAAPPGEQQTCSHEAGEARGSGEQEAPPRQPEGQLR